MCGIAGYWQDRPAADAEQLAQTVTRMAATLSHRGPDAGGCWVDPADGIALGHRRLAIVDLSDAGAQPMRSADGRLVLSYNGELYNAPALRRELQQAGQAFSGHCDTEVVLNAFLVWGVEPAHVRAGAVECKREIPRTRPRQSGQETAVFRTWRWRMAVWL